MLPKRARSLPLGTANPRINNRPRQYAGLAVRRGYRFTSRRRSKQTVLSGNQIKKSRQGGLSRIDVQSPPTVTVPPSIMMTSASPPSVMMTSAAVMTPTVAVAASYLNKRTIGIGERIGVYPWHRGSRQDRGEH